MPYKTVSSFNSLCAMYRVIVAWILRIESEVRTIPERRTGGAAMSLEACSGGYFLASASFSRLIASFT